MIDCSIEEIGGFGSAMLGHHLRAIIPVVFRHLRAVLDVSQRLPITGLYAPQPPYIDIDLPGAAWLI